MPENLTLDDETHRLLHRFGFDAETFASLRARLKRGEAGSDANRIDGHIEAPAPGDVRSLPAQGSPERARLAERGRAHIAEGKVGAVVLAGGMATRFGGVVKAAVEAV